MCLHDLSFACEMGGWTMGHAGKGTYTRVREVKRALTGGNHCCFEFSEIVVFWVN